MSDSFKSDFRGPSQDAKRSATQKAKWAYGVDVAVPFHGPYGSGRDAAHPRPVRCSDFATPRGRGRDRFHAMKKTCNAKRDAASQPIMHSVVRKLPSLVNSDESGSSADDNDDDALPVLENSEILGVHGVPASGSQVLGSALARAIEVFEEKETVKLVKTEWSVVDDDGEEVGLSPVKRGKAKKDIPVMIEDEDDYELV